MRLARGYGIRRNTACSGETKNIKAWKGVQEDGIKGGKRQRESAIPSTHYISRKDRRGAPEGP